MSQLIISFVGNEPGPYWDNFVKLLAYPSGVSYFRAFRYRDEWIQPGLIDNIADNEKREKILGTTVLICSRFTTAEHKWYLLPIRKAVITWIDFSTGLHLIFFKLGNIYKVDRNASLESSCITVSTNEQDAIKNYLMFYSENSIQDDSFVSFANETDGWVNYLDKIAHDRTLPINDLARKSLFLRLEIPEKKEKAPIEIIHRSKLNGPIYGPVLTEGKSYNMIFSHRIPGLITKNTSIKPLKLKVENGTNHLELSSPIIEITGNYQKYDITISTIRSSGVWEEISFFSDGESLAQDGTILENHLFKMPIKIKPNMWYRFANVGGWVFLIFFTLFIKSLIDILERMGSFEYTKDWIFLFALMPLITAYSIFKLQQKGISVK